MVVYFKAGGKLRDRLKPDIDHYTRKVEYDGEKSVAEILKLIDVDTAYIAFIYVENKVRDFSYIPKDGQTITLQPPVSGG